MTTLMLGLCAPAPAIAGGDDVIRDCVEDGDLDRSYSQREYREAQEEMPSDVAEYTDCRDQIRRAQARSAHDKGRSAGTPPLGVGVAGGGGMPPGLGAPSTDEVPPTPAEVTAVDRATKASGERPVELGGSQVKPTDRGVLASSDSSLPTPLLVALILLALGAVAATVSVIRSHGPGGSRAA